MGISIEQWRARIGTYNGGRGGRVGVCGAHWNLFDHKATFWITGEIMSTTPLTVQAGVAFVSLWMVLCAISCWWKKSESSHSIKLNRGSSSHWSKDFRTTVSITVCVSLVTAAAVLFHCLTLLLIMAGDVELNPGPGMDTDLTLSDINIVYEKLFGARTEWLSIGLDLKLDYESLKSIDIQNRENPGKCLLEMIAVRLKASGLTWRILCECLRSPTVNRHDVAEDINSWSQIAVSVGTKRQHEPEENESFILKQLKLDSPKVVDLRKESWKEIEENFGRLITSIRKSLQERNVQPKQLVECLCGCFHDDKILKKGGERMFMEVRKDCEECKSLTDFWSIVLDYNTFYSYKLLKIVANSEYAVQEDKKNFEKYEEQFMKYSKEVVAKYAGDLLIDITKTDGVTNVVVKIKAKFRHISDEHLDEFKEKLAIAIGVLSEHLHLIDLRPGCTVLLYHAPLIVEVAAFPLSALQEAALIHLGVIWLRCGNYMFPSEIPDDSPSDSDPDSDNDNSQEESNTDAGGNSAAIQMNDIGNIGSIVFSETPHTVSIDKDSSSSSQTVAAFPIVESASERKQQQRKFPAGHSDSGLGTSLHTTETTPREDELLDELAKTTEKDPQWSSIVENKSKTERTYRDNLELIVSESHLYKRLDSAFERHDNTLLHVASYYGNLLKVKAYIELYHYNPSYINRQGNTALHVAVEAGHLNVVKYLVKECQVNPACKSDTGSTPLHIAAQYGHCQLVTYLIDQGVDPLVENEEKETPLFVACRFGNKEIVELLIQKAQQYQLLIDFIDNTNLLDETVLHCAVKSGNTKLVKCLISKYKASQIGSCNATTPFHLAVSTGNMEMVNYFCSLASCDTNAIAEYGSTAVHFATEEGFLEALKYFYNSGKCKRDYFWYKDNIGHTPLQVAAEKGHIDCVKFLHGIGGGDVVDTLQQTPLHSAAKYGHFEVVKFLASCYPAHMNLTDVSGFTPLHLAVHPLQQFLDFVDWSTTRLNWNPTPIGEYLKIVKFLTLKMKCDPESKDKFGNTPLHYASQYGLLKIVKFLVTKVKCNPNSRNKEGIVPIHLACKEGHIDIIQFLLETRKCSVHSKDTSGKTALDFAAMCAKPDGLKYLITKHGCDPLRHKKILQYATIGGSVATIQFIVQCGCNPNASTIENALLLHSASMNGHLDMVKYLIKECKCSMIARVNKGKAPLHLAAENGHYEVVRYLALEQGYDPQIKDDMGATALHYAVRGKQEVRGHQKQTHNHMKTIQILVEDLHCDFNLTDYKGVTPLQLACQDDRIEIVRYFIGIGGIIKNKHGTTPLHWAATGSAYEATEYLVSSQLCSPACKDKDGNTPLHLICLQGEMDENAKICRVRKKFGLSSGTQEMDALLGVRTAQCLSVTKYLVQALQGNISITNNHGQAPIHLACEKGHLNIVKELHQTNFALQDSIGRTPLHYAAMGGHLIITQYLIYAKADPLSEDVFHNLPLHYAAALGHLEVVQLLAKNVSPLTTRGVWNKTPAEMAAAGGHNSTQDWIEEYEVWSENLYQGFYNLSKDIGEQSIYLSDSIIEANIVHCLEEKFGLNVLPKETTGRTLLHYAALYGYLNIVKHLTSFKDIDTMCRDDGDHTPAHLAACNGQLNVLKHFKEVCKCDLNTVNKLGELPLHLACKAGHLCIVQYLVDECGSDPNKRNDNGFTPIHFASLGTKDQCNVISYLTEIGCNPMVHSKKGVTPLHLAAAACGHVQSIQLYINDLKCDPNITTRSGRTPLHVACKHGCFDNVKCLLNHPGCNVSIKDSKSRTSLHIAVGKNHHNIAQLLLQTPNCDPIARDSKGVSPVHLALQNDSPEMLSIFLHFKDAATGNTILHMASENGLLDIVQVFYQDFEYNTNLRNRFGRTPLHLASEKGQAQVVKFLVKQRECNVMCIDSNGVSPLHLAAKKGDRDIITLLTSHSQYVPLMQRDNNGLTPLYYAVHGGSLKSILLLIEKNFDPNCIDDKGNTILHAAIQVGAKIKLIKKLLPHFQETLNNRNSFGLTPFLIACINGQEEVVDTLLLSAEISSLMITDFNGANALHHASLNGHMSVVKRLVSEQRYDPMFEDQSGNNSLHYSALNGHVSVFKYLVTTSKCDCYSVNHRGLSPLHAACATSNQLFRIRSRLSLSSLRTYDCSRFEETRKLAVIRFSIREMNCDQKLKDAVRNTPVHYAAENGFLKIIKCLVADFKYKCDSKSSNKYGCTPLDIATVHHNQNIVKFLQQHNTSTSRHSPPSVIHLSALLGHISSVQHYITDLQYDPNLQDSIGRTPLHYAAMGGHLIIAQYLISFKADPLSEDVFHNLPLHYAAALGHLEVIQFLAKIGSPLTIRGVWNKTPAEMASAGSHHSVVDYLSSLN